MAHRFQFFVLFSEKYAHSFWRWSWRFDLIYSLGGWADLLRWEGATRDASDQIFGYGR